MLRTSIQASCSRCTGVQTKATARLSSQTRSVHLTSSSHYFFKTGDDPPSKEARARNRDTGISWHLNGTEKKQKSDEKERRRKDDRSASQSRQPYKGEHFKTNAPHEYRHKYETADKLIRASKLANAQLGKHQSDQFSGWRETKGSGSRKRVTPHPLSKDALRSKAISASLDGNTSAQLGQHTSSILFEPLVLPQLPRKSTIGVRELPESEPSEHTPSITFTDFVFPRLNLTPGDFVEIRCGGASANTGMVMPYPADERTSGDSVSNNSLDLFVLLSTGEIAIARKTDVMISIPNVVELELTLAASPETREHIIALGNVGSSSYTADETQDQNTSDPIDRMQDASRELEPVNEARFQARSSICNKIRLLERQKEREMQRLLPVFQSIFLVDQEQQKAEHQDLQEMQGHFTLDEDLQLSTALADRMDLRTGTITTPEATKLLYQVLVRNAVRDSLKVESVAPLTAATIYACHTLLMNNPAYFLADSLSHRTSQLFTCRTTEERQNLELGVQWESAPPGSAEHGYIANFCEKAKRVRAWRESHPYNDSGVPRIVSPPSSELDVEWSEQDKAIINFFLASVSKRRAIQEDTHGSVAMAILKRSGAHISFLPHPVTQPDLSMEEALPLLLSEQDRNRPLSKALLQDLSTDVVAGADLQHSLVMRFLKDIGVLPDWQNPMRLDASFRTITLGEDGGEPEPERPVDATKSKKDDTSVMSTTLAQKYELTLDESIENMRVDFGRDQTVYVIDSADAFELDDGISIEPVLISGQETEQAWVHIHIADPTALVQPNSALDLRANRRFTTLYFPEARWAMLPDDFVGSDVGLRQSSQDGVGQRTMTFSALVDLSSGLVQDTKVQPGLVYDVQTVTYDKVSKSFLSSGDLPTKHTKELSMLFKIAEKLSEIRARGTSVVAYKASPSLSISPLPLPSASVSGSLLDRPQFYGGFPTLDMPTSVMAQSHAVPRLAEFMVAELMVLAGRVAGTYGSEHRVPLPYRAQPVPEVEADIETLLGMRRNVPIAGSSTSTETLSVFNRESPDIIGHGVVAYSDMLARGISVPQSVYTSSAAGHFMLGIPPNSVEAVGTKGPTLPQAYRDAVSNGGYLRASSPLRRYPDMVVHWQLKHHLVHGRPRLRTAEINAQLPQFQRQETMVKQLSRAADRYWVHSLVRYALTHHNDSALPDEERARLRAFIGPLDARVDLSAIRVDPTTFKVKVRVTLDLLGTPADLMWDVGVEAPPVGAVFKVVVTDVLSSGIRSGLVVRRIQS